MNLFRFNLLLFSIEVSIAVLPAQTLYTPGGTLGPVANSSTNVGVGTASPTYRLSIEGTSNSLTFRAHSPGDFIFALAGDGNAGSNLDLFSIRNADTGVVYLNTVNNARMAFGVSAGSSAGSLVETMTISPSGSVGIGTVTPSSAKLVVASPQSSATNTVVAEFTKDGGTNLFGSAILRLSRSIDGESTDIELNSGGSGPFRYGTFADSLFVSNQNYSSGPYGSIQFVTNNAVRLTIGGGTLAGNVGIGTTNPTQKLSVNGAVRAKEVIVDTGWSDYVFAPDYQLPALSTVEAQIKAEKHLPGIPSAAEVAAHGISVGEMQAKLLAKIEELTLHQIEQEKQLAAQQTEVSAVKAENTKLRREVETLQQSAFK